MIDDIDKKKILVYGGTSFLYVISVPFVLLFMIFGSVQPIFLGFVLPLFVLGVLVLAFRYLYSRYILQYVDKGMRVLALWLNVGTLVFCVVWFGVVREQVLDWKLIFWLQDWVAPFLVFLVGGCFVVSLTETKRVTYFYHQHIYQQKQDSLSTVQPAYHPKFASDMQKAMHFNKRVAIELFAMVVFLFAFCGTTPYGLLFGLAYAIYFVIGNKKRMNACNFLNKSKITLFWVESVLVILSLTFACLSIQNSAFVFLFRAANDQLPYDTYGNLNFVYLSILCAIPSIIIAKKLANHYKTLQ